VVGASGDPPTSSADPALTTVYLDGRATARHLRKSKLVIVHGPDAGREKEISKARFSGGRSMINDLVLSDKSVSGSHFEIVSCDDGYRLRDLGSTNGLYVGDLQVKEVYLRPGTTFRAGHSEIRFVPTTDIVEIPLSNRDRFHGVIGSSLKMREIFALLEKVAPSELTVLITGETGTGKELVAQAIHNASPRRARPMVVLDCSAIPRDLMESTVFGHERGSFTGAVGQHKGVFEQAQGGTIFLDEIGELDLALQPKLLRVLENRELKRVGGDKTLRIDVRVVAATNRDLRQMINAGTFREDLYFRLSVIQVELPPLRERLEDIPPLVQTFLRQLGERWNRPLAMSAEAMQALKAQQWSGNVRELRNVVERAASFADGNVIARADLHFHPEPAAPSTSQPPATAGGEAAMEGLAGLAGAGLPFKEAKQRVLDAFELVYLRDLLQRHEGNITRAANEAGLTRYHLRELLKRHHLTGKEPE
jgi:transcriptional regulator with GAF, ATPase, and Fis domain